MNGRDTKEWYPNSSKEWKREWIDSKTADLVRKGHSKQYARAKAKYLYREQSRYRH